MALKKAVKKVLPSSLAEMLGHVVHAIEALLAQTINGFPARNMKVIGVTGTDGKTTTCFFIHSVLVQAGHRTAMITTAGVDLAGGEGVVPSPTKLTTAGPFSLAKMIKMARSNGAEILVLETSSHALHQNRVWGIPFWTAVFTNLSHEHLDYHKSLESYRRAKVKLFELVSKNRKGSATGIVNADDASAQYFAGAVKKVVKFGISSGDIKAQNIKLHASGSRFTARLPDGHELRLDCKLPGKFNIYNCLAAIAVAKILDVSDANIEKGLKDLSGVAGRSQKIEAGQKFDVIVDYAVTPAALQNLLDSAHQTTSGRVILVFGATGDRDWQKRPAMGQVAASSADQIYLTDDETYTEDPVKIRQEVLKGIDSAGALDKTSEIGDRGKAIKMAMAEAKAGDCVLITGIGHQKSRNMGGVNQAWDELEVVKQAIKARLES